MAGGRALPGWLLVAAVVTAMVLAAMPAWLLWGAELLVAGAVTLLSLLTRITTRLAVAASRAAAGLVRRHPRPSACLTGAATAFLVGLRLGSATGVVHAGVVIGLLFVPLGVGSGWLL